MMAAPLFEDRFAGTRIAVRDALTGAGKALAAAGVGDLLQMRAQIALGEILNNVVEHAYGGGEPVLTGDILLRIHWTEDGLRCDVRDWGKPLPGGRVPPQTYPPFDAADVPGLPEGGFGWGMVHDLCSALVYRRVGGQNKLGFHISVPEEVPLPTQNAL